MKRLILRFILRDVKRHFGFLLERGYHINEAQYFPRPNGTWVVDFKSQNCNIEISSDRDEINVSISPSNPEQSKTQFSIESITYFLTDGREVVGSFEGNLAWGKRKQFERLASLLKRYLDQIEFLFGKDFERQKTNLVQAQKKYNELSFQNYVRAVNDRK